MADRRPETTLCHIDTQESPVSPPINCRLVRVLSRKKTSFVSGGNWAAQTYTSTGVFLSAGVNLWGFLFGKVSFQHSCFTIPLTSVLTFRRRILHQGEGPVASTDGPNPVGRGGSTLPFMTSETPERKSEGDYYRRTVREVSNVSEKCVRNVP